MIALAMIAAGACAGGGGTSGTGGRASGATGGSVGTGGASVGTGSGGAIGSGGTIAPGTGGASVGTGSGGAGTAGVAGTGGRTGAGGGTGGGSAGRGGATGAGTGGSIAPGTGGATPGSLPAFPGADGAAARVSGGRGGTVYHVTRLDTDYSDIAPGTLRYGLTQLTGPRTIVFDVSGVISLGRAAVAGWDANGNGWDTQSRLNIPADVTIAGQTAPGPVIIMGGNVNATGTNIILRNIIFAPGYGNRSFNEPARVPAAGDFPDSYTYDAIDVSGQNVMIDHITAVYATDETVSMNELANNVTVQYCNISQGQNYPQADAEATSLTYTGHALGSLLQAGSNARISILHNLYAHLKGRLPRVGTEATVLTTAGVGAYNDFRNNVFYNWLGTAGTGASAQPSQNNFINNFYLAGPGGDDPVGGTNTGITTAAGGTSIFNGSDATNTKVFHAGNLKDINKDADANDGVALANADFGTSSFQAAAFTQTPYLGVTDTATAAYARVLDFAGATWWSRSAVDARIIGEARAGTGRIVAWADDPFNASAQDGVEWRGLIATPATSRPAGYDTDGDGMPDTWEVAHGLNPNLADNNGDFDGDGYTNLEEYLNEVAAWPAAAELIFDGKRHGRHGVRYAELDNWRVAGAPATARWQPSRFDVARIAGGTTAVVDAVGQHAGTLRVGGGARGAATLRVIGGWLEIAGALHVGAASVGDNSAGGGRGATLSLSGGVLSAARLVMDRGLGGAGGRFDFTGGTLRAGLVGFDLRDDGGVIAPGPGRCPGPANMRIAGDLTIARGALAVALDENAGSMVTVSGVARLGGELRVETARGFAPRPGDAWTILFASAGIKGRFTSLPRGYAVRADGSRLVLTFVGASASVAAASTTEPRSTGAHAAVTARRPGRAQGTGIQPTPLALNQAAMRFQPSSAASLR